MRVFLVTLSSCLLLLHPPRGVSQEWTRFRGPNGSGIYSAKTTIPSVWGEKDFNWKFTMPGPGHSSPVVWADRIFVTSGDSATNQFWVMCVSASEGKVVWRESFPLTAYSKNALNSAASGSPAVDAQRVYFCITHPEHYRLLAFGHDGSKKWEKDLGPYKSQHGGGLSPMVYRDLVIVPNEQDGDSFIVALDATTGETRWKTARKTAEAAYGTPCVYETPSTKPTLVFASHAHGIYGLDPANGKAIWEYAGAFDKRVVSSPSLAGDLVLGSCGSGGGGAYVVAVRPGQDGKKPEPAYTIRKSAPYVPTRICVGDLLFLWADDGAVTCVKAPTGDVLWQERLGKRFFSSPVCADGRIFCISTTGEVVVIRAADKFELLGRNPLNETTHSTPAIANGRMYIHTTKHLISVGRSSQVVSAVAP